MAQRIKWTDDIETYFSNTIVSFHQKPRGFLFLEVQVAGEASEISDFLNGGTIFLVGPGLQLNGLVLHLLLYIYWYSKTIIAQ